MHYIRLVVLGDSQVGKCCRIVAFGSPSFLVGLSSSECLEQTLLWSGWLDRAHLSLPASRFVNSCECVFTSNRAESIYQFVCLLCQRFVCSSRASLSLRCSSSGKFLARLHSRLAPRAWLHVRQRGAQFAPSRVCVRFLLYLARSYVPYLFTWAGAGDVLERGDK